MNRPGVVPVGKFPPNALIAIEFAACTDDTPSCPALLPIAIAELPLPNSAACLPIITDALPAAPDEEAFLPGFLYPWEISPGDPDYEAPGDDEEEQSMVKRLRLMSCGNHQ